MVAMVYTELGEDARADQSFQRALQLGPTNPDVNNNYGWYLCQRGREKESLAYFENALKDPLYTQKAKPLQNAGVCAKKMGDAALAEDVLPAVVRDRSGRSCRGLQPRAALLRPAGLLAGALLRLAGQQRSGADARRACGWASASSAVSATRTTRSRSRISSSACSPTPARRSCSGAASTATERDGSRRRPHRRDAFGHGAGRRRRVPARAAPGARPDARGRRPRREAAAAPDRVARGRALGRAAGRSVPARLPAQRRPCARPRRDVADGSRRRLADAFAQSREHPRRAGGDAGHAAEAQRADGRSPWRPHAGLRRLRVRGGRGVDRLVRDRIVRTVDPSR